MRTVHFDSLVVLRLIFYCVTVITVLENKFHVFHGNHFKDHRLFGLLLFQTSENSFSSIIEPAHETMVLIM